ncbi:uncharacterized protein LOC106638339 isoform X2 [Copidosoma floridanum]|uniref:uncharacterized protein LOC106638339 isoform X2 n=1 Tax=Copidosoma floridanum TaxID=29053 RepID=UPI0006C9517B|nr:uncharacterized protein LOC106638339 isoform X2 [Copidosoma floridanum]
MARPGGASPLSPTSPLESRIPRFSPLTSPSPLRRTGSQRTPKATELFPIIAENSNANHRTPPTPIRRSNSSLSLTPLRNRRSTGRGAGDEFSDSDSVRSLCSTSGGLHCDHPNFALNGSTYGSRGYLHYCAGSLPTQPGEYRTPTQRATQEVRHVQSQLRQARKELDEKNSQISQLTMELVELRLYKTESQKQQQREEEEHESVDGGGLAQPDDSKEQVGQMVNSEAAAVAVSSSSLVDSGHFDAASSTSSTTAQYRESGLLGEGSPQYRRRLRELEDIQELKQNHNDRVEALLNQLSEMSTRYFEAVPRLEQESTARRQAEKEVVELRAQLEQLKTQLAEQEERVKNMYLKMYAKSQETNCVVDQQEQPSNQVSETDPNNPDAITVPELLKKLSITEAELEYTKALYRRLVDSRNQVQDPEITDTTKLQFLKSAVYYFLTDKENLHGHLKAIESILGFTDAEKLNIDKAYGSIRK